MEKEVIAALITGIAGFVGSLGAAFIAVHGSRKEDKERKKLEENIEQILHQSQHIFSEVKETLQEVAKTVKDPQQKREVEQKIESLENQIGGLREIFTELGIWKEAGIWLENNRESLIQKAVDDVLKKYKEIRNPGRALEFKEDIEKFKESLRGHLQWIWANLNHGVEVPLETSRITPRISDSNAYREAFESIKNEIIIIRSQTGKSSWVWMLDRNQNTSKNLSSSAVKVLLEFVEALIKEYS